MFSKEEKQLIMDSITGMLDSISNYVRNILFAYETPSVMYRPKIFIDGDRWCALYGDNLQHGVAGFGDSPEEAMSDFNNNFKSKLSEATVDQNVWFKNLEKTPPTEEEFRKQYLGEFKSIKEMPFMIGGNAQQVKIYCKDKNYIYNDTRNITGLDFFEERPIEYDPNNPPLVLLIGTYDLREDWHKLREVLTHAGFKLDLG